MRPLAYQQLTKRVVGFVTCLVLLASIAPTTPVAALSECQRRVHDSGVYYFNCEQTKFVNCSNASTNLVGSDNAEKIWNFFTGKGFAAEQAAGIMGNFEVESPGLNPDQEQVGGPAYGLAQWEGGRRQNLEQFARDQGRDVASLDLQLDFVMHELNGSENRAYEHIKKQTTVPDATISWLDYYERAGVRKEAQRIAHAEDFFNNYGSLKGGGSAPSAGSRACAIDGRGFVAGNYSLPIDKSWFDKHPDWYTKPHHSGRAASDLPVPEGTVIYSMSGGTVISAPNEGGYGRGVTIDAGNGVIFIYGHGTDGGSVSGARQGDKVNPGQVIMHSGNTGSSTGPHLHVEIQVDGQRRCPQPLFEGIRDNTPPDPRSLPAGGCTYSGGP